jgi:hypothetical protein
MSYASNRAAFAAPNDPDVDAVFDAILHKFSDAQRWRLLDKLVGRIAGWCISERRQCGERFPERNAEIRRRHREGMSYGQLALEPYGLTKSAIAKICQRGEKSVYICDIPRPPLSSNYM